MDMSDYHAPSGKPCALVCDGGLAGLPLDVLIRLMGYLDPIDIILLRMVCRYLRNVSLQRTVWIRALSQSMSRNVIFLPPFSLADMSTAEVECMTLAHGEFSRMVRRRGVQNLGKREGMQDPPLVPKLRPAASRTVHIDVEEELNAALRPSLNTVSGGRYVVVTTHAAIRVVDLGPRYDSSIPERPVFTLRRTELTDVRMTRFTTWRLAQWSVDRRTGDLLLFISVQQPSASPLLGAIVIYKVADLAIAPTGLQLARLMLPHRFRARVYNSEGHRICFGSQTGTVGVWDFVRNRGVRWRTRGNSATSLPLLSGRSVIYCDPNTGTYIYKVPPLKPTSDGVISYPVVSPAVTIDEVPPRSLITRPSGYSFATHLNGKQERFYDIRGCHGQVKRVGVMDCTPTFPQARRGIPYLAAMTTFKAHQNPEPYVEMSYLPRLHVCEDAVFTGSHCSGLLAGDLGSRHHGAGISLHMSDRQYEGDAKGTDAAVVLLDYDDPEYRLQWYPEGIDFCPVSGRLCAADSVGGTLNLSIFDYTAPCARAVVNSS